MEARLHVHALAENGCLAKAGGRETSAFLTTQALTVEGEVSKSRAGEAPGVWLLSAGDRPPNPSNALE